MKVSAAVLVFSFLLILGSAVLPHRGRTDKNSIVIFVNKSIAVDSLTIDDVKRIFLKVRSEMKDGSRAVPVNAKSGSALRKAFVENVLEMTEVEEIKYWQDQKIKRGVTEPAEFANTQKAVFSLTGGIGYCYESEHIDTVNKVVLRL